MVFSTSTPLSRTKVASWYISLPTLYWYRSLVVSKSVYTVLEVSSARLDTFLSLSPLNIPTMVVLTVAVECDSLSASYGIGLEREGIADFKPIGFGEILMDHRHMLIGRL